MKAGGGRMRYRPPPFPSPEQSLGSGEAPAAARGLPPCGSRAGIDGLVKRPGAYLGVE